MLLMYIHMQNTLLINIFISVTHNITHKLLQSYTLYV